MNQQTVPTFYEASMILNDCHKMALSFQLNYLNNPSEAQTTLHQLHTKLATLYKTLPHPDSITQCPPYEYATFYHCIHHLYHNPLTQIDVGNQMCVTQSYIDVILHTKTHLHS